MKQPLLITLVAVNTTIVTLFAFVPYALISAEVVAGILCGLLVYKFIRHQDSSLKTDLLLIATVFLFPLLLVLVSVAGAYVLSLIAEVLPAIAAWRYTIGIPVLSAYYWIPFFEGIVFILFAIVLLGIAWRYCTANTIHKAILVVYTITIAIFVAYVLWWHITGQKLDYV